MNINRPIIATWIVVFTFWGCSPIEISKTVWGSSTRALEEARVNGIIKTYDAPWVRCYDEVLKAVKEAEYEIFIDNRARATIVVMGIKGSVNTTEVGIFFSEISDSQTKIYISSLSSNAKRTVAGVVFPKLDLVFGAQENQATTTINDDQN